MKSAHEAWTENCPYCNAVCDADFVDVGVGLVQCGPFHCEHCYASQIGPHDTERELTEAERKTGWYAPNSAPGSSANVVGGKIISHRVMRETYKQAFTNNPLWHDKSYVDAWWEETRKQWPTPNPLMRSK